jgi:NAD(P)-dependent dehydrogenase (short-subunit alcohol dehydrogenase family)
MAVDKSPLEGRSALVTGGGGGIGAAAALLLARDGAAVTLMGRNTATLARAEAAIRSAVPEAQIALAPGDAMSPQDMSRAIEVAAAHGAGLDILVGTVGGGGQYCPVIELEVESFIATVEANLRPPFLAIRCGAQAMTRGGAFVFISSCAAEMALPRLSGYAAGKAGLDQLVRCAALELGGRGIRLNAVRPGLTRTNATQPAFADAATVRAFTEFTPLGRLGEPVDVAGAVRFLAGPESGWITGQSFAIDGGSELRGPCPRDFELGEVAVHSEPSQSTRGR